MRAGAGLVTLGIPKSLHKTVAAKLTEVMVLSLPETKEASLSIRALKPIASFLKNVNTLLIGPGLSQNPETSLLVRQVIACADVPMVVDADALNALAGHLNILKKLKSEAVLTPHPGEMARLADRSVREIQKDRIKIAKDFAVRYNMNLVLKGNRTVVASRGREVYINRTGNPGMATGGSGDVLAGIIAAFLAQGLSGFQAAKYGVYVHGLSGDLAAKDKTQVSLIASDLIDYLPRAFKKAIGPS
jgi:NAD(P)H-hydrate epimerase